MESFVKSKLSITKGMTWDGNTFFMPLKIICVLESGPWINQCGSCSEDKNCFIHVNFQSKA